MTASRRSLELPLDVAPPTKPFNQAMAELCGKLDALDREANAMQRRALVDDVAHAFESWALSHRRALAQPDACSNDLQRRRARCLRTLQLLVREVQCIPAGQQLLDHRLKRLQWTLHRYCQLGENHEATPFFTVD